jgi:hypothetical protein
VTVAMHGKEQCTGGRARVLLPGERSSRTRDCCLPTDGGAQSVVTLPRTGHADDYADVALRSIGHIGGELSV